MSIDPRLIDEHHQIIIDIDTFLDQFNKIKIKKFANAESIKNYEREDYPLFEVYDCLNGLAGDTGAELFPQYVKLNNNPEIKEEDVPKLNLMFQEKIKRRRALATDLRDQIIFTPFPYEPLSDFQEYFLKLDPYCYKLKERLREVSRLLGEVEQCKTPREKIDLKKFKEGLSAFTESREKWDFISLFELRYFGKETTDDIEYDPNSWDRGGYTQQISHGSLTLRIFKDKYHLFYDDYETAVNKFTTLFNNLDNLLTIFAVVCLGQELIDISEKISLEKKYKVSIWEDGNAIVENFDIRGLFRFRLTCICERDPCFLTLIQNEQHREMMIELCQTARAYIRGHFDYMFSEKVTSQRDSYKAWEHGEKLFQALKQIVEEQ